MSGNKSLAGAIGEVKKAEKTAPVKETEYKAGTKDFFDQFEEKPAIKKPKKDRRLEIRVQRHMRKKADLCIRNAKRFDGGICGAERKIICTCILPCKYTDKCTCKCTDKIKRKPNYVLRKTHYGENRGFWAKLFNKK